MIFRIAICDKDPLVRIAVQRQCEDFFSRRIERCQVTQMANFATLLQRDAAGERWELYFFGLDSTAAPEGLSAATQFRKRGRKKPLVFLARSCAHAYRAYRLDAMQYLLCPIKEDEMMAMLARAVEPEYEPKLPVPTPDGMRVLPHKDIEYVECTHHVVHFHMTNGLEVHSLSQRVPFTTFTAPLLADGRFIQAHRAYLVNLAEVRFLTFGEFLMQSGARIPVPREREKYARAALATWLEYSTQDRLDELPSATIEAMSNF
jgi:DNA-binding LytR/AlgR family response regulator